MELWVPTKQGGVFPLSLEEIFLLTEYVLELKLAIT